MDRWSRIAERLQRETAKLVDYRTIEERSRQLGFPTTVRTLRFYVSERILPAPQKQGKTPVYPEDWILNVLAAIYLMKTRFHRSLAEIRTILQHLREDPESLADKCAELYDMVRGEGHLRLGQYSTVVDRFFARLSGSENGSRLPPQPSEVLLTDLIRDVESEPVPLGATTGEGTGSAGAPRRRTADARRLEDTFIRHFEKAFQSLERIFDGGPRGSQRWRSIPSSARTPVISDEYEEVARALTAARVFDRELFESLPLQKSTRFEIRAGLLGGAQRLRVVAANWSPVVDLVRLGHAETRLGMRELEPLLERFGGGDGSYTYLGVHATCGLQPQLVDRLPASEHVGLALIEYDGEIGWRVWNNFPAQAQTLARLFDPEPLEAKAARCRERLLAMEPLAVRGGYVELSSLPDELRVSAEVLDAAVRELTAADGELEVLETGQRQLLKRKRF